jgi:hypothetical protein
MSWFNKVTDTLFGSDKPKTEEVSGWTPEQRAWFSRLTERMGSEMGDTSTPLGRLLAGIPSTEINPETTRQFYQSNIYEPSMRTWREDTLPSIRESMGGNFWSTARQSAEQSAATDLQGQLSQAYGQLQYQDEQARRDLAESALSRVLNAYQTMMSPLGSQPQSQIAYNESGVFDYLFPALAAGKMIKGMG